MSDSANTQISTAFYNKYNFTIVYLDTIALVLILQYVSFITLNI